MSQIRDLFRATDVAMRACFERNASHTCPLPFPVAELVIDEDELAIIEAAILGRKQQDFAPVLTVSYGGPWIWGMANETTTRLALLPPEATMKAAESLLDIEEDDLSPQAQSKGATRAQRVEYWRETLEHFRPFCLAAMQRGEGVFLYHSL
jgi:hypothetical protein